MKTLNSHSRLLALAALLAGCSGPITPDPALQTSTAAIVKGEPAIEEDEAVVQLYVPSEASCTATLIAPNVVVTAAHCVTKFNDNLTFKCNLDGTISPMVQGAGEFGDTVPPDRIEIRTETNANAQANPDARGARVFTSGTRNICSNDIALVVLDTSLAPTPKRVRLGPTKRGEFTTVVGYGRQENDETGTRMRRTGLRVLGVGEYGEYPAQGVAAPRTLVVGEGQCLGDSGGPTFSEATGAITGVFSIAAASGCISSSARNTSTQVAPFERLIREAMDFAGAELMPEIVEEPATGGAGGDTGMGGMQQGGEPASGGSSGGSGTARGGGSGRGGSVSTSGGSSSASGGSEPVDPTGGSAPVGQGSGSRKDPTCGCRFENLALNHSSSWLSALSLASIALLRRRSRATKLG